LTTQEIVAVLRREARADYRHFGFRPFAVHKRQIADALRRASKRLARLEDDALAEQVAYDSDIPDVECAIAVYRRAVRHA